MRYDIPIRYLARAFFHDPPTLTKQRTIGRIAATLNTEDLEIRPLTQVSLEVGRMFNATALQGGQWHVVSTHDSVDLEFDAHGDLGGAVDFPSFLKTAAQVFSDLVKEAGSAFRLACVSEGMLAHMTEERLETICRKMLNRPPSFAPAFEWDWRCVKAVMRKFDSKDEETNTLAMIKRISGHSPRAGGAFDRLRVDLDINTTPKDRSLRFPAGTTRAFFEQGIEWHSGLAREISNFMGLD